MALSTLEGWAVPVSAPSQAQRAGPPLLTPGCFREAITVPDKHGGGCGCYLQPKVAPPEPDTLKKPRPSVALKQRIKQKPLQESFAMLLLVLKPKKCRSI